MVELVGQIESLFWRAFVTTLTLIKVYLANLNQTLLCSKKYCLYFMLLNLFERYEHFLILTKQHMFSH
jgi:hypothetical protein